MNANTEDPEKLLTRRMLETFGVATSEELTGERIMYGPMSKAYLGLAARIVDNSGVVARLDEWDAARRKSGAGRKPTIPYRAVLILLLIHIQMGLGANYQEIANTLQYRFNAEHRSMLGITDAATSRGGWYQRMRRSTVSLLNLMDPYPSRRNKRLDPAEFAAQRKKWDSVEGRIATQSAMVKLDWMCEQLVHSTVRMLPADIWARYHGNIAIDATKLEIAGRPNSSDDRRKRTNADPFSERYRREGNHNGEGAKTDVAAYELENAVMVWNNPGERHLFPSLTLAVTFHQPGRLVGHGLRLVESVVRLGVRPGMIMADRAYNGEQAKNFQIPVRLKGWKLAIDYKKDDLGIQSEYKDLILVEGTWYVATMPDALILGMKSIRAEIEDPDTGDKRTVIDEEALAKLLKAREPYRMIPKGRPDADGYQRYSYPRPGTYIAYDRGSKRIITPDTPGTITIPIDAGTPPRGKKRQETPPAVKYLQEFPYMSPKHQAFYGMRSLVESSHKMLKEAGREDIANKRKRSGRGYAFHYLAAALAAASTNLRKIESFFVQDYERSVEPKHRTRRRKTLTGTTLARTATTATAPPA